MRVPDLRGAQEGKTRKVEGWGTGYRERVQNFSPEKVSKVSSER